jgi:ADP-heptose:LPS heptosyltransferase
LTARRILVKRTRALGDVIMTTPIVRRLRHVYGDDAVIDVQTDHPEVFYLNPHITAVGTGLPASHYHRVIDLDGVYEKSPDLHVIDAYMKSTFGFEEWPTKETYLHRQQPGDDLIEKIEWHRAVVIHPGVSYSKNRTLPMGFWLSLAELLQRRDYQVVAIGTEGDHDLGVDEEWLFTNLVDELTIHETAWVISRALCFVSCDQGPLHIAGTTETLIVGIFTSHLPAYRAPWRAGVFGWRTTSLVPVGNDVTVTVSDSSGLTVDTLVFDIVQDVTPENVVLNFAGATDTVLAVPPVNRSRFPANDYDPAIA